MGPRLFASICAAMVLLLATLSYSQVAGGRISGVITDPSGSVLPQATVTVENPSAGLQLSFRTLGDGSYQAPNLIPGRYTVSSSASGFAKTIVKDILLTVGGEAVVNLQLRVGPVSQEVQVTSQGTGVDTVTSTLNAVVASEIVRELPLNGRDWTSLATLQPGIANIRLQASPSDSASRGNRGFGNQLTVVGHRPEDNNYRIDGVSINDYSNSGPGSAGGLDLGVESIQEFSVLSSNYSAEYGRTSGGVINAITRSGTNSLHGSVFEFLRNSALDARNFFDGTKIPPFKRNQFGASAGGPIHKNTTFIFGDYEGLRLAQSVTNTATVPSPNARNGQLASGTVKVDPAVVPYLKFWPLPNAGLLGNGDTGLWRFVAAQTQDENFFTIRADQQFSQQDKLFGTYMFDDANYDLPDGFNNFLVGNLTRRQMVALEYTHMFTQSFANSLRYGYNRTKGIVSADLGAINPLAGDTGLGAIPGRPAPIISVSGITTFPGGAGANSYFRHYQNSYQVYDDAILSHGKHALKLGFAYEWLQYNEFGNRQPNGNYAFGSLVNFLTNKPTTLFAPLTALATPVHMRQRIAAGYVQDDWKLFSNLVVNVGMRYETSTKPTEADGTLLAVRNLLQATPPVNVDSYFIDNPTLKNFAPRVGFSWDPFKDQKTAIRGGFGLFDALPLLFSYTPGAAQSAPYAVSTTVRGLPAGSFPRAAYNLAVFNLANAMNASVDPFPKRSYLMNWNLNIQRKLVSDLIVSVAYVGSRGVHMGFGVGDANIVLPTLTAQGYQWPTPRGSGTRTDPNVGVTRGYWWNGSSYYNGLQAQLQKSFSHGFQFQGAYTFAKCMDTESNSSRGDQFANGTGSWPFTVPNILRRSYCDYDLKHVFVFNTVYDLPTPHWGRVPDAVLGGWEIASIVTRSSGPPFSAVMGGDPLGRNDSNPLDFPNRLTGPGCDSLVNEGNITQYINVHCFAVPAPLTVLGNARRNILRGPGLTAVDFSLYKNIPISEAFRMQFRTEVFNILNHTNLNPPLTNNQVFDQAGTRIASAGLITSTQTTSRQIQFGLKLYF